MRPADDSRLAEALRRVEQAARERASGERLPVPEARAMTCEICGSGAVRWGALCRDCRQRLQAASGRRGSGE